MTSDRGARAVGFVTSIRDKRCLHSIEAEVSGNVVNRSKVGTYLHSTKQGIQQDLA